MTALLSSSSCRYGGTRLCCRCFCQHGRTECILNQIQACLIEASDGDPAKFLQPLVCIQGPSSSPPTPTPSRLTVTAELAWDRSAAPPRPMVPQGGRPGRGGHPPLRLQSPWSLLTSILLVSLSILISSHPDHEHEPGRGLLAAAGEEQSKRAPRKTYVPWLLVDGRWYDNAVVRAHGLSKLVCHLLANGPPSCSPFRFRGRRAH